MFDVEAWKRSMQQGRDLLSLKSHEHDPSVIMYVWMIAIQARYIVTDSVALYKALRDGRLLRHTIGAHGVEGFICSCAFFMHNSSDTFMFGITCVLWTVMWLLAYFLIDYDKIERPLEKVKSFYLEKIKGRAVNSYRKLKFRVFREFDKLRRKLSGDSSVLEGDGMPPPSPYVTTAEEKEKGSADNSPKTTTNSKRRKSISEKRGSPASLAVESRSTSRRR
jgi:hypothetical protein